MNELKLYRKKMGIFWWTRRLSHIRFISRELTSLAVAFFSIELLLLINAIRESEQAYISFLNSLSSPFMLLLNAIAALGLLFHSITWFSLAPKAMVIRLGRKRLPGFWIILGNYLGWLVLSVLIIWVIAR